MKQTYKTPIRQMILDCLVESNSPTSIEQIAKYLESSGTSCEFSTVFRQVKKMVLDNKVREFYLDNKSKMYELIDNTASLHYHLICENCEKVFCGDIKKNEHAQIQHLLNNQSTFDITAVEIKVKGTCKNCQELKTSK